MLMIIRDSVDEQIAVDTDGRDPDAFAQAAVRRSWADVDGSVSYTWELRTAGAVVDSGRATVKISK